MSRFFNFAGQRPPHRDHLPLTLGRRRIYILPTPHGWLFLFILLAMLIGSINYNNNLGFMLVFLLGAMALISMIHTHRNLHGLTIVRLTACPVFAGQSAVFNLHVDPGRRRRTSICFFFKKDNPLMADMTDPSHPELTINLPAKRRGRLKPNRLTLASQFPLGLFRAWSHLHPDADCLVYPAPIAGYPQDGATQSGGHGNQASRYYGPDDFQGLRAYQPGDSPQHIAWKALSRGQGLFTKQFNANAGSRTIMFDLAAIDSDSLERKLSVLCDQLLQAHRMDLTYGLQLAGQTFGPARGIAHMQTCLKALALYGISDHQRQPGNPDR